MATYAFSDLHGNYNLWTQIKKYCQPNDKLIFLGDAIDRGPDGIKIMQELLDDNRVIYIRGNHEEDFLSYIENGTKKSLKEYQEILTYNGCIKTLNDYQQLSKEAQSKLTGKLTYQTIFYYIYINKEKKNIFLSHAGINFSNICNPDIDNLLFDRSNVFRKNFNEKYEYWYIVHGHTPVQVINIGKTTPEIYRYANNHKIDIDMGTFESHIIALLDLDTLQVKYFKEEKNESRDNE